VCARAHNYCSKTDESVLVMKGPCGRINIASWGPLNKFIISAGEDTIIHMWDPMVSYSGTI